MTERYEFGLDTFGDVTVGRRRRAAAARAGDPQRRRGGGAGRPARPRLLRRRRAPPRRVRGLGARGRARARSRARTERIRLGSAVTVLSSDDPVRVFQRFSTLDALSNGRAEVILGRGSFTESFPLFGFELSQYEELFEEKLDLFVGAAAEEPVTWSGELRAPLDRPARLPAGRARPAEDLGRRRRQPRVGRARRALRPAAHARDHRRQPGPVRARSPTCTAGARAVRASRAADRDALAGLHRRHRRAGARGALAALQGACTTASAASAAGRR